MPRNPSSPISPEHLTVSHVRDISLHEVTQNFGTLGLYLRLHDTLQKTELDQSPDVAWSTQFGLTLHANDTRTNGHYADHLLRVTLRIIEHYGVTDPEITAAAMLHDSVEDHAAEIVTILGKEKTDDQEAARPRAFELLAEHISPGVVDIVRRVTNPIVRSGEDKLASYAEHTKDLVFVSPQARVLKLSDFTDNAVGNHYTVGSKQTKLDDKYVDMYQIHRAGLFMPDSLITGEQRMYALHQLSEGHARALARLAL